jgi:hypothetical protein
MNKFVLQNIFIKVHIYSFLKIFFIKNKKLKLYFGYCVAVLNDVFMITERVHDEGLD